MQTHWLMVVLTVLTVYRLTILVTQDIITQPSRDWMDRNFEGKLVEFIFCPWCVSMWLGAGCVALAYYEWGWVQWPFLAATASGVTGFLAERS